jgi:hypothetical protein
MVQGRLNARAVLVALTDPRGLDLSPQIIAGIARANAATVRDWMRGTHAPPEAAVLRLIVGERVLAALLSRANCAEALPGYRVPCRRITCFADLVARHCRSAC